MTNYTDTIKINSFHRLSNLIVLFVVLLFIFLGGVYARMNAQSVYKIYPDSYSALVVAENINTYNSVVAPLGADGMLYPDYFGWTRPMFPLFINAVSAIFSDTETAAKAIALFAGIISIPIAYLFISSAFNSRLSGLLGALLLATSFNHSIWGGFIMSDTTGVLFLFITLWLVFRSLYKKYELAHWQDLLTGVVFALAILTRYEYALLVLPFAFLFYSKSVNPISRFITIMAGTGVVLTSVFFFLSPLIIDPVAAISQIGFMVDSVNSLDFRGLLGFIFSDSILVLFFLLGTFFMFRNKMSRQLIIFSLLSIVPLWFMYYQTNPMMQRYFIHLIPFILLPASAGFTGIIQWAQKNTQLVKSATIGLCGLGLLFQGYVAYQGLHSTNNGLWFKAGYEERAAELARPFIPQEALVIASFPEPYFLTIKHSTHSITDAFPFLYISDSLDSRTVVIVEDEGMRRIFPTFSAFLRENAEQYIVNEIPLQAVFRYGQTINNEVEPIRLYSFELGGLKKLIAKKI